MIGLKLRYVAVLLERFAQLMWAADITWQPQMTGSYEWEGEWWEI